MSYPCCLPTNWDICEIWGLWFSATGAVFTERCQVPAPRDPKLFLPLLPTILVLFLLSSQHFSFIFFFINDCIIFFLKNTCNVKILSMYLHQIKSVVIIKGSDFPVKSVAVLSTFYSLLMELWTGRFCHLVKRFYPSNLAKLFTAGRAFGKLGAWQWRCWVPPGFLPIGAPAH